MTSNSLNGVHCTPCPAIRRMVFGLTLSCVLGQLPAWAQTRDSQGVQYGPQSGAPPSAQNPPTHAEPLASAGSAPYSGCVMQSLKDKNQLLLSTDAVCAVLTGKLASPKKLAGHEIDLKGVLTPRTDKTPGEIHVDSVTRVGKSCSDLCSLQPPGSRKIGGEKPGKEGGTPGAAPTSPQ